MRLFIITTVSAGYMDLVIVVMTVENIHIAMIGTERSVYRQAGTDQREHDRLVKLRPPAHALSEHSGGGESMILRIQCDMKVDGWSEKGELVEKQLDWRLCAGEGGCLRGCIASTGSVDQSSGYMGVCITNGKVGWSRRETRRWYMVVMFFFGCCC